MLTLALAALAAAPQSAAAHAHPHQPAAPATGMHWGDYDADGFADAVALLPGGEARLLRNLGDGTLEDVTALVGLPKSLSAKVALWGDYDGDGALDLYLGSLDGESRLWRQAAGTFQDVTERLGLDPAVAPLAARWIDYDGDGTADLHLSTASGEVLYHGLGGTAFERVDLGLRVPTAAGATGADMSGAAGGAARVAGASAAAPVASGPEPDPAGADTAGTSGRGGRRDLTVSGVTRGPSGTAALGAGICVDGLFDQDGGACIQASNVPTLGMLYPMDFSFNVDETTSRVGIRTSSPSARLDVNGTSSDPYAIEATIYSTAEDVAAIYGDATGDGTTALNAVHGVLGRADGGGLGARGVLGIMDRNSGGRGQAAVEGRFTQGVSSWGNFQSGVYGTCLGAYGVRGVGNEVTIWNGNTRPGCGVRGEGYGEYTGSGTFSYPATGVWGTAHGDGGHGVRGEANVPGGIGVLGQCDDPTGWAGFFEGPVEVDGADVTIVGAGTSKLSFVEGSTLASSLFYDGAGLNGPDNRVHLRSELPGETRNVMTWEMSGDVGIATSSPDVRLHVASGSDAGITGGGYLQLGPSSGSNVVLDSNEIMARSNGAVATLNLNVEGGDIVLGGGGTVGSVGVGTSSPNAKLEVLGPAGGDAFRVRVDGTTRFLVDDSGQVAVGANIATSYDLQVSGSAPNGGTAGKPGGGSWSNSSDRRLKKNIEDLEGALDTLLALRGVTFEYIDPEAIGELSGTRVGFIAQEVEPVIPDWVDEKPDGMKMLTVRGFEALAVEALRELHDENAELRASNGELRRSGVELAGDVEELRQRNSALAARVERLEALVNELASPGAPADGR